MIFNDCNSNENSIAPIWHYNIIITSNFMDKTHLAAFLSGAALVSLYCLLKSKSKTQKESPHSSKALHDYQSQ